MPASPRHLHLVSDPGPPRSAGASAADVALVVVLLAIGLVPVVSLLAGAPSDAGSAGAGTALALLSGRELCSEIRAHLRARVRRA